MIDCDCNITSHDNVDHDKNSKACMTDQNNNFAAPFIVYEGEVMHPLINSTSAPLFTSMPSNKYNVDTILMVC